MAARIYEIPQDLDVPEELSGILPLLPQWRLKKALAYRRDIDRFLCAKSFLILEEMLREYAGMSFCPEFAYGKNGKPFLLGHPELHFNLSHCGRGIACAVLDRPVGIDIEEIQYDELIAGTVFNTDELASVRGSDEPEVKFTELWTMKESYLKLTGEGISNDLKDVLSRTSGVSFDTEVNRQTGYVCSVACRA